MVRIWEAQRSLNIAESRWKTRRSIFSWKCVAEVVNLDEGLIWWSWSLHNLILPTYIAISMIVQKISDRWISPAHSITSCIVLRPERCSTVVDDEFVNCDDWRTPSFLWLPIFSCRYVESNLFTFGIFHINHHHLYIWSHLLCWFLGLWFHDWNFLTLRSFGQIIS